MSTLAPLRAAGFRRLFLAQCASLVGTCMAAPALAFAVLDVSGSARDLGWVLAASAIPHVVFLLAGGVVADRFPRHAVMLGSDLVRAAAQAMTAVLVLTGRPPVGELVVLQVVNGVAAALFTPAISGLVQATTRPGDRRAANALRGLADSASMIAGPMLAAVVVTAGAPGWAIAIDAASFLASAALLSRIRVPAGNPRPSARSFRRDLADGWREFRTRRWVWSVIVAASLINMCWAAFIVLGPVVSAGSLGGARAWAFILAASGLGCFAGAAVSVRIPARFPLRSALGLLTLFALPVLSLAVAGSALIVAAGAFCGGAGLMIFNSLWETTLQHHIPAGSVSRVSAYEWFGSLACRPLGLALVAPIASRCGMTATLLATGFIQVMISLFPLMFGEVRSLRAAPAPEPEAQRADEREGSLSRGSGSP